MRKKTIFIIVLLIVNMGVVNAQNTIIDHSTNWWNGLIGKYQITNKWYASSEVHIRRANYLETWQQFLFRPAINYALNENVDFTIGYTYILTYPYGNQPLPTVIPENNLWEQILLKHNLSKVHVSHRYRLENRWIGNPQWNANTNEYTINGINYANRFRYRLTISFPVKQIDAEKGKNLSLKFFDEVFLNLNDNLSVNSFNQNWIFGALVFNLNKNLSFTGGFMNQYFIKGDRIHIESNPSIQFGVGYKLDFRKKDNS
jgi:hypothetical protein